MFQFQFHHPTLVHPDSINCNSEMEATTFRALTLAEIVFTNYCEIMSYKHYEDICEHVVSKTFRLCPEQVVNFVALHETYREPFWEGSIAFDMNYLVLIDMQVLYDFQPLLEMHYKDPTFELGHLIRVEKNSLRIHLEGDWVDLSVVPYDEFFKWIHRLKADLQLTLQPRVFVNCNDPDVAGEDDPLEYYDEVLQKTAQLLTNI